MMSEIHFSVYEHRMVYGTDTLLSRHFIVLKDQEGDIVGWTDFHKYAASKTGKVKRLQSDNRERCYAICKLLNYVFFVKYRVTRLVDITAEMIKDYLNDYGLCRLPGDNVSTRRQKQTVETHVTHILDFFHNVMQMNKDCLMKEDDLYVTKKVFNKHRRKYENIRVLAFDVVYKSKPKETLRDIPEEVFQMLMNEITENHTNILILAALSAFAGLRPSESCNCRRADSPLGEGIRFETVNGEIVNVFIDLTEEKNLRSDLKYVGEIKKERTQRVYPAFLEAFVSCYNTYMDFIHGRKYEKDYGALTNTISGKAYTYRDYYKEFELVVKACIPKMLNSDNPKLVLYGQLLQEMKIAPHILRHWFSVKLTLYGEDVAGLMFWRGDKSPESALQYLQNKSELVKQYQAVNEEVLNYNLWRATKMMKGK